MRRTPILTRGTLAGIFGSAVLHAAILASVWGYRSGANHARSPGAPRGEQTIQISLPTSRLRESPPTPKPLPETETTPAIPISAKTTSTKLSKLSKLSKPTQPVPVVSEPEPRPEPAPDPPLPPKLPTGWKALAVSQATPNEAVANLRKTPSSNSLKMISASSPPALESSREDRKRTTKQESPGKARRAGIQSEAQLRSPLLPRYPRHCRRFGHEGTVELSILIDTDGDVVRIRVVRSSGCKELDDSAIFAVRKTRFLPARIEGLDVSSTLRLPVEFRLR